MKQCYEYIRVSTQKQGEGVSLEAQREAILAFASRQDLAVARWFEEKETAAKSGRRVFNQMLRDLQRGAAAGLIMHKIDRSARNLKDWATISDLSDAGIDVYFATRASISATMAVVSPPTSRRSSPPTSSAIAARRPSKA